MNTYLNERREAIILSIVIEGYSVALKFRRVVRTFIQF